ncbi:MAG: nickel pincer cofactor biosynthesis protein LarC [Planctomycetaceae bacterium]|nr:nickel pincer cofactor biosynthesis protein LarC [Planctomycetaceae bacterium]
MTFAYFDCPSGISGDMMLGALIDLGVPLDLLNDSIQSVIETVTVASIPVFRKEFRAIQADVRAPHEHAHRSLSDILTLVSKSNLSADNQRRVSDIFRLLAEAEAKVHGCDVEKVHFHEVGAADSIADIVGAVVGLDHLGITDFGASAIPTGTGTIKMAHGECSIPAPATAELLKGIPIAASDVRFELTTPTGAVFLKYYVKRFGSFPAMTVHATGVGAGSRDLEQQANIFRILVGDLPVAENATVRRAVEHQFDNLVDVKPQQCAPTTETVWVVETNIDDMPGELLGHCVERLWTLSPLDVWVTPIQMKKQRPGVMVSVLCRQEQVNSVEQMLFSETSTLGVRRYPVERTVLYREPHRIKTPWGEVEAKRAFLPDGTEKIAPEFESVKRLAAAKGVPVWKVMEQIR